MSFQTNKNSRFKKQFLDISRFFLERHLNLHKWYRNVHRKYWQANIFTWLLVISQALILEPVFRVLMDFFLSFSLTIVSPISRQFFWQLKKRDLDLWIRIYSKRTLAVSRHLGENAQLAFQNFNITDLKWRLHKLGSHILFCAILGPRLQIFHSSFITWQPRQKIMRTRKIQFELVKLLTHKETCSNFRRFRFLRGDFFVKVHWIRF